MLARKFSECLSLYYNTDTIKVEKVITLLFVNCSGRRIDRIIKRNLIISITTHVSRTKYIIICDADRHRICRLNIVNSSRIKDFFHFIALVDI